jgi:hypothetical protein
MVDCGGYIVDMTTATTVPNASNVAMAYKLRSIRIVFAFSVSGGSLYARRFVENAHDVALLHNQQLFAVELHLGA